MWVLGISAFYHDSAAVLLRDGDIVGAAQEERFTRKKHDPSFPRNAIRYCLQVGGIRLDDVDYVAFYDKPLLKFERLLETYLAFAPRGFRSFSMAIPLWLREKLFQKFYLKRQLEAFTPNYDWDYRLLFAEHHQSHAASAFFPSRSEEHTSELQSPCNLVCRLLLEKKNINPTAYTVLSRMTHIEIVHFACHGIPD